MATATTQLMVGAGLSSGASNDISATTVGHSAVQDHPDGAIIRRQVEFYFSDENLPTDLHLLQCCGGRENLPVSVSRIMGFKKMRSYKPRTLVVAALRLSAFLEITADGKAIKRKVPLQGKCVLDPDFFDEDDIAYDPRTRKPAMYPVPKLPQKKAEYPEGVSKNMLKPTGFEKTYIEPPQTPQEVTEEEALYSPDKDFVERIEIAIQRFKKRRRMHEIYAHVFNKLMRFGGVESGPRMYQGVSKHDMNEMDAEELARALAIHNVPWDRSDPKQWAVDFVAVAKAFLSSWYPAHYGFAPSKIKNACQVLRSFFNYLLYHNVCPEYADQLGMALTLCDTAERELPKIHAAGLALPGDFNKSASVLFGGAHAGMYTGDKPWAQDLKKDGVNSEKIGIRDEEARIKFLTGIGILGSDELCGKLDLKNFNVLEEQSSCLEVVAIHLPDENTKNSYAEQSKACQHKLGQLEPLGKLICKTWYTEECDGWDLPKDEAKYPGGKPKKDGDGKEYEFWIEEGVLEDCFVGMKMDAKMLTLSGGLNILDDVKETMCSFYTWIPNELWMERKPKPWRWLEKGKGLNDDEVNGGGKKSTDKGTFDDESDGEY
ncbi:hypothetical protein EJ02DRAFT_505826 [Clathrospora elynae]|uniref:HTH La-type RNA-binding domain-containing protein n=1 Tax=Clathrospora elynae TaxID=706981 RepID=A0A6A5SDJ6_9PLEO|nr:hypothetical protein EJ02DRAFT_505826 [Clathrospora elynae]